MPRRDEVLDPEVQRELDALDSALAGKPVALEFEGLAALAQATRAERPEPTGEFAAALDAWAASGFGAGEAPGRRAGSRGARLRARFASLGARRMLVPALGAVASLLLVVVVAGSLISGGGEETSGPLSAPEPASAPGGATA